MTRAEFLTEIAWEGKIKGDTETLARIPSLIQDAMIFIGQTHPELLLMESITYDINTENPTDYVQALGVNKVELYLPAISGGFDEPITLPEESKIVGPAPVPGWPKAYMIRGNAATSSVTPKGISVELIGGGSIDPGVDAFIVTWKMIPTLTDDTHVVPDAWLNILKKEVLARLAIKRNEMEAGKAYGGATVQAAQVETQTDAESQTASN